jgi:Cu+-exporting ATPase
VDDFQMTPGLGVMVVSNGGKIRVGNVEFIESAGIQITSKVSEDLARLRKEGKTAVLISVDSTIVALIGLIDIPKAGAREAVEQLKRMGLQPVMLTGDNEQTARVVAENLGIDLVHAGVLPSGKFDVIKQLQRDGSKVAMVGDGFNDAPALTVADVGIAMGAGTDLAIEAGSVVLVRDDIKDIVAAVRISRKVVSKIRQNLVYAFMYNVILVPVAGLGLLYPALAGLAMAASSLSVTASSLALRRWNPRN